jgi:glycosyltransferase involved in cell wall biosynthesis
MRILTVHNRYLIRAGEDMIWRREQRLLEQHGHEVLNYTRDNREEGRMLTPRTGLNTVWNERDRRAVRELLRAARPDVMTVHNHFPLISPAVYYAARAEGVPVVQTLHNYRLLCPGATLFRDGRVCEDCLGRAVPWPGVVHGCYRGSRMTTAGVAAMLATHNLLRTWQRTVSIFIVLNDFARNKFIEGGLSPERIVVKPNFVDPDPGVGDGRGGYALYVGRLSAEKGIETMIQAWQRLGSRLPLKIAGDGPLADRVSNFAREQRGVEYVGCRTSDEVFELMKGASFVLVPSQWYEGMPLTIIESFAVGTPVVASNLGSMSSLVSHRATGLHFRPIHAEDLVAQVEWALAHPDALIGMRERARAEYEAKYTAERSYRALIELYGRAQQGALRLAPTAKARGVRVKSGAEGRFDGGNS